MRMEVPKTTIDLIGPTECSIGTVEDRDRVVRRLGPDPLRADADPDKAYEAIVRRVAADWPVAARPEGHQRPRQRLSGRGVVPQPDQSESAGQSQMTRDGFRGLVGDDRRDAGTRASHEDRIVTLDRELFDIPEGMARRGDTTYVYHRDLCLRCGNPILTVELGGRACYYCPVDQPRYFG